MSIELRVPEVGESIREVQLGRWLKKTGDRVRREEGVLEIETDKISFELPAPADGVLAKLLKQAGEKALVGEVVGYLEAGSSVEASPAPAAKPEAGEPGDEPRVMPSARRVLAEAGLPATGAKGTGPGGRVLKEDAERAVRDRVAPPAAGVAPPVSTPAPRPAGEREERMAMSPIRKRIAERLLEAQSRAALLTTFNEIDMSAVIAARKDLGDRFREKHGVKLGFMSFFVKAAVDALKTVPQVNARVEGEEIVFANHYDVGIAVGGGRGLVVPVIRDADRLSFAEVEKTIADFAARAEANRLELAELTGGTFTISNGGIYGSMLSTPIVNPPQSGILGLHAIQDRPVGRDGQIVLRPMMYVALTYDHRIVDGRESVAFLRRVKDCIEDPARMLLEI
ncbi:MAG: 2-oxoglutarate dehydrogenase complex dihydrolipoyllysine-residue succinyltransferase [Planctomycetes bacterium]|jgi:2-oxoglutarate dehydrogenase E2 component (dihydrolipoamide succinyltransferase)|nr:2-oxoglutarate dehydrogenase complex dihydrolipoyllysine-residue succinyltransferase [Planctomycetota bacterium]